MERNTLKSDVDIFIEKRLQESHTKIKSNKEYQEIFNQYFKVFQNVQEELADKKDLWEQYETKEAEIYEIQLKQAYKKGFKDSMKIFTHKDL